MAALADVVARSPAGSAVGAPGLPVEATATGWPTWPECFLACRGSLKAGDIQTTIYRPPSTLKSEDHPRRRIGVLANAQTRRIREDGRARQLQIGVHRPDRGRVVGHRGRLHPPIVARHRRLCSEVSTWIQGARSGNLPVSSCGRAVRPSRSCRMSRPPHGCGPHHGGQRPGLPRAPSRTRRHWVRLLMRVMIMSSGRRLAAIDARPIDANMAQSLEGVAPTCQEGLSWETIEKQGSPQINDLRGPMLGRRCRVRSCGPCRVKAANARALARPGTPRSPLTPSPR